MLALTIPANVTLDIFIIVLMQHAMMYVEITSLLLANAMMETETQVMVAMRIARKKLGTTAVLIPQVDYQFVFSSKRSQLVIYTHKELLKPIASKWHF